MTLVKSWSDILVALALICMTAFLLPVVTRRFKYVGWRYRVVTISGAIFSVCTIAVFLYQGFTHQLDGSWFILIVGWTQAIAGIILAGSSIGYVDVVFNNRNRVKSDR